MELKDLVKYYVPMRMEGSSPPNWEVVFGYDISKFKGYTVDEVRVALNLTQLWLSQGPRDKATNTSAMHACEITLAYLRGGLSTCSVVWVEFEYFSLKFINVLMQLCTNFL